MTSSSHSPFLSQLLSLIFMTYEVLRSRNPAIVGTAPLAPDLATLRSGTVTFSAGDFSTVGLRRSDASSALQERTIETVERVCELAMEGNRGLFPIVRFTALSQKGRGEKPHLMLRVLGRFLGVRHVGKVVPMGRKSRRLR